MNNASTYHFSLRLLGVMTLLIVSVSCKKVLEKQTTISGHAINMTDNTGLSGYDIHLVEIETPTAPFSPLSSKLIATTTTDENGHFKFDEHLRRRSRFEYFVLFDDNGDSFKPDGWQSGAYERVKREVKIEKGEANLIELTMVPNAKFNITVTNNSGMDSLFFEGIFSNQLAENRSFYQDVKAGHSKSNGSYLSFAAGQTTLTWNISNDNFSETRTQIVNLPQNQETDIEFTYE